MSYTATTSHQRKRTVYGKIHAGGAMQHLFTRYPTMIPVNNELVQNGIDMGAKNIFISIDLDIGNLTYRDDGIGANEEHIHAAVQQIYKSLKTEEKEKYGRFGQGFFSPLSICKWFTFTSARHGGVYIESKFDRKRMLDAVDALPFDLQELQHLSHADGKTPGRSGTKVWWRTQIRAHELTQDKEKRKVNLNDLAYEIQSHYSARMLKLGTTVTIEVIENGTSTKKIVRGKEYEGKALDVWSRVYDGIGRVTIRFFLSPAGFAGPKRINVGCGENPSRINFNSFSKTEPYRLLNDEVKTALGSGHFQGEIVGQYLEMDSNRRTFVRGDAIMGLTIAIEEWYNEIGARHFNDQSRLRKDKRFQLLGAEVMDRMKHLFWKDSRFALLVQQASFGSTGEGHKPTPGSVVKGADPVIGLGGLPTDNTGGGRGKGGNSGGGESGGGQHKRHVPNVSIGREGGTRKVVEGHSKGPHIQFDDFESDKLWTFNAAALHLRINVTHPDFVEIEKSDYRIRALVELILVTALELEILPLESREHARLLAESVVSQYVRTLLTSGSISRSLAKSE